jgi:hypothetical protein
MGRTRVSQKPHLNHLIRAGPPNILDLDWTASPEAQKSRYVDHPLGALIGTKVEIQKLICVLKQSQWIKEEDVT